MTPEPQRMFTDAEQAKLDALVARCVAQGTASTPLVPFHGHQTFHDIAMREGVRQIAADAMAREMLRITGISMDGNLRRMYHTIRRHWMWHRTWRQVIQHRIWKRSGGAGVAANISIAVVWHIPPHLESEISDAKAEQATRCRILPILAAAIGVAPRCFDEPLVGCVVEPEIRHQGITITLGRED